MTPTQAQIEAAAKAIRSTLRLVWDQNLEVAKVSEGNVEVVAKAALTAAAEVTEKDTSMHNPAAEAWLNHRNKVAAAEVGEQETAEAPQPSRGAGLHKSTQPTGTPKLDNATIERCAHFMWDVEIEGGLAVGTRAALAAAIRTLREENP